MHDHIHLPTEYRVVAARRGLGWLSEGFGLFMKQPGMWILIWMAWLLIHLVAAIIPFGNLAISLIDPAFTAGFMVAAAWQARQEPLDIAYLFAGFRQTGPLLMVGLVLVLAQIGLAMLCIIVIVGVILAAGVNMLPELEKLNSTANGQEAFTQAWNLLTQSLDPVMLTILLLIVPVAFLLYLLLAFGLSMAPALICLGRMEPMAAMQLSMRGVLGNWLPFTLYGLVGSVLLLLAILPFLLGLLVLMPVLISSMYRAYKDIYPDLPEHLDAD